MTKILSLLIGWALDLIFGDPKWLPHPIVAFGKAISTIEHSFNKGKHRLLKGALTSILLVLTTYLLTYLILIFIRKYLSQFLLIFLQSILIFYCLAGTTLIREVRAVFKATAHSIEEGRQQVSRIVGRDTQQLNKDEIHAAALETLSENLSDGVIAPLFWFMLLGVPGMIAYKMINTLDSMIGYHTQRYLLYGRFAARLDDVANYVPARLTACLMLLAAGRPDLTVFVRKYGRCHASPNAGYPEAALAGILNCRFGGTHTYFGEIFQKPYIGYNARPFNHKDLRTAIKVNRRVEFLMIIIVTLVTLLDIHI